MDTSTVYAKNPKKTTRDVVPVRSAKSYDDIHLGPGFWVSKEGLSLMVSEGRADKMRIKVLERHIRVIEAIPTPEPVTVHEGFNIGDMALSGVIGVTLGFGVTALIFGMK